MSELGKRITFGVIAAPVFMGVVWLGGWAFKAMILAIVVLIQLEITHMLRKAGFHVFMVHAFALSVLIFATTITDLILPFLAVLFLWLISLVVLFPNVSRAFYGLMSTLFVGVYAPIGFLFLILMRDTMTDYTGFVLAFTLILMVWGSDIFAYFIGKNFGKRLLAPNISPKKTWEGVIGGLIGALFALTLCWLALPDFPFELVLMLPLALVVCIAGPFGDLFASRLKRAVDVKDSSALLPGHGGFFDRFDAMLAVMPAAYVYLFLIGIVGG